MARRVAILTLVHAVSRSHKVVEHLVSQFGPSPNAETQACHTTCCANQTKVESKVATTRRVSPLDPALSASLTPRPTHLGRRISDRPRRQQLLHHRRMPFRRSKMKRRVPSLRRAAAPTQANPLSAQVIAPPPTTLTLSITILGKGKQEMERDDSLAAKLRCHEILIWGSQTFALMA